MKQSIFMFLAKAKSWLNTSRNCSCWNVVVHSMNTLLLLQRLQYIWHKPLQTSSRLQQMENICCPFIPRGILHGFWWQYGPQLNNKTHKKTNTMQQLWFSINRSFDNSIQTLICKKIWLSYIVNDPNIDTEWNLKVYLNLLTVVLWPEHQRYHLHNSIHANGRSNS